MYDLTSPGDTTANALAPVPLPPVNVISGVDVYPAPELTMSTAIIFPAVLILAVIVAVVVALPVTTTMGVSVYPVPPSNTVTESIDSAKPDFQFVYS